MIADTERAIRAGFEDGTRENCRLELTEELRGHLTALLRQTASTPPAEPAERLRAAGSHVVYLPGLVALLERHNVDAELDSEGALLVDLAEYLSGEGAVIAQDVGCACRRIAGAICLALDLTSDQEGEGR